MRRQVVLLCFVAFGAVAPTAASAPIAPTQPISPTASPTVPKAPLPPKLPEEDKCAGTGPLELYMPFTGNANDASGKCRNGAALGPILTKDKDGVDGRAYDFDNDAIINVGRTSALDLKKLTVAAWVKVRELPKLPPAYDCTSGSGCCGSAPIVGKSGGGNSGNFTLAVRTCFQDTKLKVVYSHGFTTADGRFGSTAVHSADGLTKGQWTHVAATYDGTNMRVYLGGKLAGTLAAPTPQANLAPIRIGRVDGTRTDAWIQGFKGAIDEVRVYSTALSDAEIAALLTTAPRSTFSSPPIVAPDGRR